MNDYHEKKRQMETAMKLQKKLALVLHGQEDTMAMGATLGMALAYATKLGMDKEQFVEFVKAMQDEMAKQIALKEKDKYGSVSPIK